MANDLSKQSPRENIGADTISRYRYQAAVAGYLALQMFDSEIDPLYKIAGVISVYCEHHEDILVETVGPRYTAIQVKTRHRRRDLFKATDVAILGAVKAFVDLEHRHGTQVDGFKLVANHGFAATKNSTDLPHLVSLAKACTPGQKPDKDLETYLKKLKTKKKPPVAPKTKNQSNPNKSPADTEDEDEDPSGKYFIDLSAVPDQTIISTLMKMSIEDTWPYMDDLDDKLTVVISCTPDFGEIRASVARKIADQFVGQILNDSRLRHGTLKYLLLINSAEQEALDVQTRKRWDKDKVSDFMKVAAEPLLLISSGNPFADMSTETTILVKKAKRGKLTDEEIQNAEDLRTSAQALVRSWMLKYQDGTAEKKLGHIRAQLREACLDEHSEFDQHTEPYGMRQLKAIRKRMEVLWEAEFKHKHELQKEHLLGFVWMLTQECSLWWSEKFDLDL